VLPLRPRQRRPALSYLQLSRHQAFSELPVDAQQNLVAGVIQRVCCVGKLLRPPLLLVRDVDGIQCQCRRRRQGRKRVARRHVQLPIRIGKQLGSGNTLLVESGGVRNTGKVAGDEVVQLYVHDVVSSVTRPVKELKGFRRVTLAPGESTTVQFTLDRDAFALWNEQMKRVVEPGAFEIMVGPNSVDLQTTTLEVTS
jgi:hypothetical protein